MDRQVVLAPLAGGPSTPELAAAVTNAGGLGFLGAGYLTADALRERIRATRALTDGPFGVNLFLLRDHPVDEDAVAAYAIRLEPEARARGVELGEPRFDDDALAAKVDVVLSERVGIVSTTFGCPSRELVATLQATGAAVWVTVTSAEEARRAHEAGADTLVVQGAEAGGHRGSWHDDDGPDLDLLPLLAAVRAEVRLPLVAAGGIVDAATAAAARAAGAEAVQAGTAFLLCPEAGTSDAHRRALRAGGTTAVTRAFTGRRARGIENAFMRAHPDAPSAYPHVHHLTAPLRAAARAAGDADAINLWAGTRFAAARDAPAAEIVASLRS